MAESDGFRKPLPDVPDVEPSAVHHRRRMGRTGGYYWFPVPDAGGVIWSVITARDLGCGPDAGHDAELWPKLIDRLATIWGKDSRALRRRLRQSYTGLPRGRVTRPSNEFLILHGNDSPPRGWLELVVERFGLEGRRFRVLFDEHETMIPSHSRVIEEIFGLQFPQPEA